VAQRVAKNHCTGSHVRQNPDQVASRATSSVKCTRKDRSKSGPCRRRIDGSTAVNCGVLLNDFEVTDLGAWRRMSDLLVKLAHDAEVHRGADGLDVCGL
jgi:hypothetical protein